MAIDVALSMSEGTFGHEGSKGHHRAEAQWHGGGAAAHGLTARRAFEAVERLVEAAVGHANITWRGHAIPAIEVVHVAEAVVAAALDGFNAIAPIDAQLPADPTTDPFAFITTTEALQAPIDLTPSVDAPAEAAPVSVETLEAEASHLDIAPIDA